MTNLSDPGPAPNPRRVRCTGTVQLPPGIAAPLGLFTPEGERAWAAGWDPSYPAPAEDDSEPGTVFQTRHGVHPGTWIVASREPGRSIRYARVIADQDAGTVTVTLEQRPGQRNPGHGQLRPHRPVRARRRPPGPVRGQLPAVPGPLGARDRPRCPCRRARQPTGLTSEERARSPVAAPKGARRRLMRSEEARNERPSDEGRRRLKSAPGGARKQSAKQSGIQEREHGQHPAVVVLRRGQVRAW